MTSGWFLYNLRLFTFVRFPLENQRDTAHRKIGIMYEKSKAIAVSAKMALAAIGLARSSRPGKMLRMVVNQIARSGVVV